MALALESITRKIVKGELIELAVDELVTNNARTVRYVATDKNSVKRARTLLSKEPTTVPWIETFKEGEVLVDIGANVGMYSVYAGARGVRVYSIEPESLNYAELNKNIFVNGLHHMVTAYCMAAGDAVDISVLHLSGFGIAWAHHDFGENRWEADKKIGAITFEREARPQQGCVSFPLDELVRRGAVAPPNHIKIDVDGFEWKVLKGAAETLRGPQLKTVLLEVDFAIPENVALVDRMLEQGWFYSKDQVRLNQHEIVTFEKFEDRKRRGKGGANYIFYKDRAHYDEFFRRFAESFVPPNPLK